MVKDLCFEIIDKCPNNCKFCSSNSCYEKNTIISFDDFKRVIDYFINEGELKNYLYLVVNHFFIMIYVKWLNIVRIRE